MSYPDIQWLTGRTNLWNENGNLFCVADSLSVFSRRKFLELNFGKPCIQQESTFWKRSLWEQAGGTLDADASLAGDLELWLRFFRYASIYTVDTFLGGYRRNDGQRGVLYAQEYLEEKCHIYSEGAGIMSNAACRNACTTPCHHITEKSTICIFK